MLLSIFRFVAYLYWHSCCSNSSPSNRRGGGDSTSPQSSVRRHQPSDSLVPSFSLEHEKFAWCGIICTRNNFIFSLRCARVHQVYDRAKASQSGIHAHQPTNKTIKQIKTKQNNQSSTNQSINPSLHHQSNQPIYQSIELINQNHSTNFPQKNSIHTF